MLSKEREKQIKNCFVDEKIDFKYVENVDEFDNLLQYRHKRKPRCNENDLRKNIKLDRLIVLEDVSSLADRSHTFANLLTVSQKFGLICVYVFHTRYPLRQNWQMLLAQTKISSTFPGSLQTS